MPTSMVKTLRTHLKNNKLPTLKVKTLSAHLNGQNPKCSILHVKKL